MSKPKLPPLSEIIELAEKTDCNASIADLTKMHKNSAMAVSGRLSYSPSHALHEDFDLPPPYFLKREITQRVGYAQSAEVAELYGFQNFRLKVLGLAIEKRDNCKKGARYVCKCSCGMFCFRTARQMKNGIRQCCGVCRNNFCRTRKEMGGEVVTDSQVWQRMGGA